jgi:hypothetical protein
MAHEELKRRQNVMWGTGPHQRITETTPDIHELVVERLAGALHDQPRAPGCSLRRLLDLWDHVRARPRGDRARARARDTAGRPHRARELDDDRGRRADVPDDRAASAGAAAEHRFDWGDETRVRELLGDWFELIAEVHHHAWQLGGTARSGGSGSPVRLPAPLGESAPIRSHPSHAWTVMGRPRPDGRSRLRPPGAAPPPLARPAPEAQPKETP